MSKIILKRSSEPNKVPMLSDLVFGELALNYADGTLYYKDIDNTVRTINSDRLVNGNKSLILGSDGLVTIPGGIIITSPNGTRYNLSVANNGDLITTLQTL